MTNVEARMTKEVRNPNDEAGPSEMPGFGHLKGPQEHKTGDPWMDGVAREWAKLESEGIRGSQVCGDSSFGFRASFDIRISTFGIALAP
jgi:hypothetical protein